MSDIKLLNQTPIGIQLTDELDCRNNQWTNCKAIVKFDERECKITQLTDDLFIYHH